MASLTNLQSLLSRVMGATYISNTDSQTAALNYARKYILLNYYVDEFCVESTLTLTSGKATIPTDYLRKVRLFDSSDIDYERVNVNDFDKDVDYTWTIKDDSGTRKIWIYDTDATSLTLRYIKLPADMSSGSDVSGFNSYWDNAHCLVAAWWLLSNDRQPEAGNKLELAKEEIQSCLRSQAEDSEDWPELKTAYDTKLMFDE